MNLAALDPLPWWLSLVLLALVIAGLRWLAWRLWSLLTRWTMGLWRVLARAPIPDVGSTRLGRRWPRQSSWLVGRLTVHRFSGLALTLGSILAVYLLFLFAGLVEAVLEREEVVWLDQQINAALALFRDPRVVQLFHWITGMGDGSALTIVCVTALALFWAQRRMPFFWGLALAAPMALAITWIGKYAIGRDRPDPLTFAQAVSPSFPSGHTTGAAVVYGFLAYALARQLPRSRQQFEVVYWALVLIALIAFSRMVLSVHYFSDILAGLLIGGFGVMTGLALSETLLERSRAGDRRKEKHARK
ncbi:MAG: phosphatase PAP2 family protein [Salinisphaera sp.]|nr:phosphatase PAP2 family protein [Salinisphaera sp.]